MAECASGDTTANEWHHVAFAWESGITSYLYHDGVPVANFGDGRTIPEQNNSSALGNIAGTANMTQDDAVKAVYDDGKHSFDGCLLYTSDAADE